MMTLRNQHSLYFLSISSSISVDFKQKLSWEIRRVECSSLAIWIILILQKHLQISTLQYQHTP